MRGTRPLRSAVPRRGAGGAGLFRLASRLLRNSLRVYRRHVISQGGLRIAMSGALLLERMGAVLVFGFRRPDDPAAKRAQRQ